MLPAWILKLNIIYGTIVHGLNFHRTWDRYLLLADPQLSVPSGHFCPAHLLVRPKTIVFGRTSVLLQMFFLFFCQREISEMRGPTGAKFCTMVRNRPNLIMPVQNFGGRTPKKFRGRKTCKIWPDFGRLRSSAANISETDEDIQNRIVIPCMAIPPALGETSTVWSSDLGDLDVKSYPLKAQFSEDHISAPRGCGPQIFTCARESRSLTSASPTGDEGPPYNFFQRVVKNWLKM